MSTESPIFCTNHPKTETLLRCNKCDRPFCVRCLKRMPVGYRCNDCLNNQQAGFWTATPFDYIITAIVGLIVSIVVGALALLLGGIWLLMIFIAPMAGSAISEAIRFTIQRRRGRYIAVVACAAMLIGSLIGASFLPLLAALASGRIEFVLLALPAIALRSFVNIGFLIYLVLGISTVYARLRN
jgi:hypothetical protein